MIVLGESVSFLNSISFHFITRFSTDISILSNLQIYIIRLFNIFSLVIWNFWRSKWNRSLIYPFFFLIFYKFKIKSELIIYLYSYYFYENYWLYLFQNNQSKQCFIIKYFSHISLLISLLFLIIIYNYIYF